MRRWPERRAVVLAAAAAAYAAVLAATRLTDEPSLAVLHVVPVMLVALELGLRTGLAASVAAAVLTAVVGGWPGDTLGLIAQTAALLAVGAVAGRFSDRLREAHERDRRLLESGLAVANAAGGAALPAAVAEAALRTPCATGAVVAIDGLPPARAGHAGAQRTREQIAARGTALGRIELSHHARIAPEDAAALELLAMQAGLAADNQRLLHNEREAAAVAAELRRVRDELLAQRSGLGRLLEAEEDDRRRIADRLHEDLAQVLAAVLLGLRMVKRGASGDQAVPLDELHALLVGVLDDMRGLATALRPFSLAQLGLGPALETLADTVRASRAFDVELEIGDLHDAVPEPLRTNAYRIVEQAVASYDPGTAARIAVNERGQRLEITLTPRAGAPAVAGRARSAVMAVTCWVGRGDAAAIRLPLPEPEPRAA